MIPHKKFDLLLDEVIEQTIDQWIEDKQREPEQLDFYDEE